MTDSSRPTSLHHLALDVWALEDVPPLDRCLLEGIARAIEDARDRLRPELGKQPPTARGFSPKSSETDVVDLMTWEDLLLRKIGVANSCADAISQADQKKTVADVLGLILKYGVPKNDMGFFWMWLCYKRVEGRLVLSTEELEKIERQAVDRSVSEKNKHMAEIKAAASKALAEKIKKEWAKGNFSCRELCAQESWEYLGFKKESTARNALKGAPDPHPWPAKKKRVKKTHD